MNVICSQEPIIDINWHSCVKTKDFVVLIDLNIVGISQ